MHGHLELSEQVYRRIYRLHQQKVDSRLIAAALSLPLQTVQNVLDRLGHKGLFKIKHPHHEPHQASKMQLPEELVAFTFSKVRYAVIDVSGALTDKNCEALARELDSVRSSEFKAVAIQMSDVQSMDQAGVKVILDFHTTFSAKGRYVALLDPSPDLEPLITEYRLDEKIPIFGTERAFEDAAFSLEIENKSKKQVRRNPNR